MFGLAFNPFKSWTVGGVVAALGTAAVNHFDPSALSPGLSFGLQALGAVVATIGARNAVAKAALSIVQQLAAKSAGR
jgi:hypothetical protein